MQAVHRIACAAAALLLTACGSNPSKDMAAQGYPVEYAQGFDDGCHSGKQAGGALFEKFKKDVTRFERDRQYAQGWSDGFRQCETQQESAMRNARMAIEHQRFVEERKRNARLEKNHLEHEVLRGVDTRGLENLKK